VASIPNISVIICTFNRADLLKRVLQSVVEQSLERDAYEVVVVNNASTDDTPEVVRTFQTRYPSHSIGIIAEPRQGLGYARNSGYKAAKGRYVAYVDDDCLAPWEWLEHILECFQQVQPEPWSVGGPILPVYGAPKPKWFKDEFEKTTWGDKARFLCQGEGFYGNNMAFQKRLLEKYGGFDTRLDMNGVYLSVGGETEFYDRMWSDAGTSCLFYYCPNAPIHHIVSPHRITILYRLKRAFAEGQAWHCTRDPRSIRSRISLLLRTTAALFWHSGRVLLRARPVSSWSSWVVEGMGIIAFCLGRAAGSWGVLISVRERTKTNG
jgi:GT2 family glycosyltransferase